VLSAWRKTAGSGWACFRIAKSLMLEPTIITGAGFACSTFRSCSAQNSAFGGGGWVWVQFLAAYGPSELTSHQSNLSVKMNTRFERGVS
jgi:hypothetical protein